MSSGNSAIDSEFAVAFRAALIEDYCYVAAAALLLYDTAITLGQEVELVWKRRRTGVTFLYITNRVLSIMLAISMILFIPDWPQLPSCMGTMIYGMVPQLLLFFVWGSFSALRVYAIGGQARWTATLVFILALTPFITNLYIDTKYQFFEYPLAFICVTTPNISTNDLIIMETVARVSAIASDAIVLVVTWRNTYNIRKHANAVNVKMSLATLLLRDGTIFFLVGLTLNAAQLGNYLKLITDSGTDISYWVTTFSCIITSRFLLSLRQLSEREIDQAVLSSFAVPSDTSGTSTMLQIRPQFVADMGGEIDVSLGLYSNGYDDEDESVEELGMEMKPLEQDVPVMEIVPQTLPAIMEEAREI